jgi:hypothetical protein
MRRVPHRLRPILSTPALHHSSAPAHPFRLRSGSLSLFLAAAAFLACAALGFSAPRTAQPAAPSTELSSNRYLLIVDTSVAMEPRGRAMLKTVEQMLKSGLGGQLREGDTLGVWTYNSTLYAGRFSLQRWSPAQQKAVTSRIAAFLKAQKYELFPLLDTVLPALDGVLRNSESLTVILVSAGDGAMQGTPFDHRINEFWEGARERQKAAKMPFVVVLRAREGRITDCTLNLPPGPVEMPPISTELQPASTSPQPGPPEAPLKVQTPVPQPPTVSAVKPKPLQPPKIEEAPAPRARPTVAVVTNEPAAQELTTNVPTPVASAEPVKAEKNSAQPIAALPAPATTSIAPPVVEAEQPKTPPPPKDAAKDEAKPAPAPAKETKVAQAEQPKPVAPVAESKKPDPKPTPPPEPAPAPAQTQVSPSVQPTPAQPPPTPNPEIAKAPVAQPAAPAQPPAHPTPTAPKVEPANAPGPLPAQAAPAQVVATPLPPPPSMPPAKAIEAPKLAFGPKPTFAPGSAAEPRAVASDPAAGTLPSGQSASDPAAAGTRSEASRVSSPAPSRVADVRPSAPLSNAVLGLAPTASSPSGPKESPAPPIQTATATPAQSFLSQRTTWIAGAFLAAAACAFAWRSLRRSRSAPHGSLITRSLDTDRKP